MNIKTCLFAHFSPTGMTAKIARAIAHGTGCPVREWDLTCDQDVPALSEEDVLLVVLPVYGGRVPAVSLERLSRLKGCGQAAVAVVVYGNRAYDDALLQETEALAALGFRVAAAAAFVAEHSIVRSIAAGRPDSKDLAVAADFGARAAGKISCADAGTVQVPGDAAYRNQPAKRSANHPAANDACIRCGICAKGCPVGAISANTPWLTDNDKCINCMRCVSVCPQGARSLPAPMLANVEAMLKKTASDYKNPELFL